MALAAAKHFHLLLLFCNRKTKVNLLEPAVPRCSTDFASRPASAIVRITWANTPHPRVIAITPGGMIDSSNTAQIGQSRKSSLKVITFTVLELRTSYCTCTENIARNED
jgi:hypothetical protein